MFLAKGERLIKEWNYGTSKDGKDIKELSVAVTNKRVVHTEQSPLTLVQKEVPVEDVTGVTAQYKTASSTAAIFSIVMGSLMLVGGLIPTFLGVIPLIFVAVLGGILLGVGIYKLVKRPVTILIALDENGKRNAPETLMAFGLKKGSSKKAATNIKIKVNKDVARNLAESIGVVILTAQQTRGDMPVPQGQPRPQGMPPQGRPQGQPMPQGQPRPQNMPPQGQVPPQM